MNQPPTDSEYSQQVQDALREFAERFVVAVSDGFGFDSPPQPVSFHNIDKLVVNNVTGTISARYKWKHLRYLLVGGKVVDVIAVTDDIYLRAAILRETKAEGIVGVTVVEPQPEGT